MYALRYIHLSSTDLIWFEHILICDINQLKLGTNTPSVAVIQDIKVFVLLGLHILSY